MNEWGSEFLQFIFGGLTNGSIYALVALTLQIVFSSTGILNFSSGGLVVIGGLIGLTLMTTFGIPFIIVVPLVMLITMLFFVGCERIIIKPALGAGVVSTIILTIGLEVTLKHSQFAIWGKENLPFPNILEMAPLNFVAPSITKFRSILYNSTGATISEIAILIFIMSLVLMILCFLFFYQSKFGKGMRASAMNPRAARLMGINPATVSTISWAICGALAGATGVLMAPLSYAGGGFGSDLVVKGFSAALLGGIGSPIAAVVGGYSLGILESVAGGTISTQYKDAISFGILFLILVLKPSGLFQISRAEKM